VIVEERCPRCEADLWVLALASERVFFVRRPGQSATEFIESLAGPGLDLSEPEVVSFLKGADSLDIVELIAEIEAAREQHGGWREAPMYDPQLDDRLLPWH
jgi:hypothetical protein